MREPAVFSRNREEEWWFELLSRLIMGVKGGIGNRIRNDSHISNLGRLMNDGIIN